MPPLDLHLTRPCIDYISALLENRDVAIVGRHGWEAAEALRLGAARAVFIDPSPARVRYVDKRLASQGVEATLGALNNTGQPPRVFDVILAIGLPSSPQVRGAQLVEWRRILRSDGFLYLILPAPSPFTACHATPSPRLDEAELRADLRRSFPHVELLSQRLFIGTSVGPSGRSQPTWMGYGSPAPGSGLVAVCSQLMIEPDEVSYTLSGLSPMITPIRRTLSRLRKGQGDARRTAELEGLLAEERARAETEMAALEAESAEHLHSLKARVAAQEKRLGEYAAQFKRGSADLARLKAQLKAREVEISTLKAQLQAPAPPSPAQAQTVTSPPVPKQEEGQIPDEIWSPPMPHSAPRKRAPSGPQPPWPEAAPKAPPRLEVTAWDTPHEGGEPAKIPTATAELDPMRPPVEPPLETSPQPDQPRRTLPPRGPRRGELPADGRLQGKRWRGSWVDDDDRPQEGELALLNAIAAANLGRLPQVTEEIES